MNYLTYCPLFTFITYSSFYKVFQKDGPNFEAVLYQIWSIFLKHLVQKHAGQIFCVKCLLCLHSYSLAFLPYQCVCSPASAGLLMAVWSSTSARCFSVKCVYVNRVVRNPWTSTLCAKFILKGEGCTRMMSSNTRLNNCALTP